MGQLAEPIWLDVPHGSGSQGRSEKQHRSGPLRRHGRAILRRLGTRASTAMPAAYARRCACVHGGPTGRPERLTKSSISRMSRRAAPRRARSPRHDGTCGHQVRGAAPRDRWPGATASRPRRIAADTISTQQRPLQEAGKKDPNLLESDRTGMLVGAPGNLDATTDWPTTMAAASIGAVTRLISRSSRRRGSMSSALARTWRCG